MAQKTRARSRPHHRSAQPQPAALPPIGCWQPVRLLGEGRFASVFQARPVDASADRPADYVLKVARDDQPLAAELLRRECVVAQQVIHPHLGTVLSAGLDPSPRFLVAPYYAASSLQAWIAHHCDAPAGSGATAWALWIIRQAAEALHALHQAGWLHADVKPSNILVSPDGHVTLIDLGFAQPLDAPAHDGAPLMASLAYAAPERLCATQAVDARSDVYSLGATLYELLTGRRPFPQQAPSELAAAHLRQPPPDPRRFVPQLSSGVTRLLQSLLAKQPLRRPDSQQLIRRLVELEIETFDERPA